MIALVLALQAALPQAPDGVAVRQVVALGCPTPNVNPVRVAAHPVTGKLWVLYLDGDLWEVDPDAGTKRLAIAAKDYHAQRQRFSLQSLGLHIDGAGRIWVVVNERWNHVLPHRAHVAVYRIEDGKSSEVLSFEHPWGVGPYNHGACHLAPGPDGLMYLGVGSRTDHGETGKDPKLDPNGETDVTAVMLRFDPNAPSSKPEVFCKGLRNPFGFDWDEKGRLIAGEHGPDADHPEELNWLRQGKHYGFPYRFGDDALPMYPDAAKAPEGLSFEKPIPNLGPDARPGETPAHTFHPHSAPCGLVFYRGGGRLPERYAGSFFVTRFGNFLGKEPVGFEVLNVRLEEKDGALAARCTTFMKSSQRPIDVCLRNGALYVLEYVTVDDRRRSRLLEMTAK